MADRNRLHIISPRAAEATDYTSYRSGRGSPRPPAPIDRQAHGTGLAAAARAAEQEGAVRRGALDVTPVSEGLYLTFQSWPGFELDLQSFEPLTGKARPELMAVQLVEIDDKPTQIATVLVPEGGLTRFLEKFEEYATQDTPKGSPKHASFVERISTLRLATIEALWTDPPELFPEPDDVVWWEVWLRRSDGHELERLAAFAEASAFEVAERLLVFDTRTIVLVKASAGQLASALDIIDDLAELRSARTASQFFDQLGPAEQADWVAELVGRTTYVDPSGVAVCVLDTGVNRGHPLLEQALADEDTHASEPGWGAHDHDGHGTEMAGLALYGDLGAALASNASILMTHRLESVKVLPPVGDNDPDLYGAITADAASRVEIQAPHRRRIFSMAITAAPDPVPGAPTSWSAAVDALAAGRQFAPASGELRYIDDGSNDAHRLFLISAGNVRDGYDAANYLERCDTEAIEDPAQAWNALTVGAFTELEDLTPHGTDYEGWTAVAEPGELSPFSRTSTMFERQWPIKPEIVAEGGNICESADGEFNWPPALGVLTTHLNPAERQFTTTNATSAATAQAAYLAAAVAASYPVLWPETVRALVVHSAEWTTQMRTRLDATGNSKEAKEALVRRYGYGVPDLARATRSANNALTLVVQDTIHPFNATKLREMHVHDLPWPKDELEALGEAAVRLRVTLSYFIEPHPTRRGWKRRYRYASHGLRFELKTPEETNEQFEKRLNKRALDEEEARPTAQDDSAGWFLGSNARNRGSLHSDFWRGTAAELAARGRVAIYPVTGWWKEHSARDQSERGARYGLVISIETPVESVDLWTPVAMQVNVPIEIAV